MTDETKRNNIVSHMEGWEKGRLKVTGICPWPLSKIVFHFKLMQRKTLNFVINLPDVENITK